MERKIENKVVDTVLERPQGKVKVGSKEYEIAPPVLATIMVISEKIAHIPEMRTNLTNDGERIEEVLRIAKDCDVLAEICALIILGARKQQPKKWYQRWKPCFDTEVSNLASEIKYSWSAIMVRDHIVKSLIDLEFLDFFHTTTSLYEINLLKPTSGEVVTIASGQL